MRTSASVGAARRRESPQPNEVEAASAARDAARLESISAELRRLLDTEVRPRWRFGSDPNTVTAQVGGNADGVSVVRAIPGINYEKVVAGNRIYDHADRRTLVPPQIGGDFQRHGAVEESKSTGKCPRNSHNTIAQNVDCGCCHTAVMKGEAGGFGFQPRSGKVAKHGSQQIPKPRQLRSDLADGRVSHLNSGKIKFEAARSGEVESRNVDHLTQLS